MDREPIFPYDRFYCSSAEATDKGVDLQSLSINCRSHAMRDFIGLPRFAVLETRLAKVGDGVGGSDAS